MVNPERYTQAHKLTPSSPRPDARCSLLAAQVIRMYRTLLGEAGFRKGMDLYFERHDGQAVSCDDFRSAMADANKVDLDQFERWYLQVRDTVLAIIIVGLSPWRYHTR